MSIVASGKVADVTSLKSADSVMECFTILQDENIFSKRDVIFVQFLCNVTGCKELYEKCKDYALSQKALCCFERQIENGYTKVQFHVQGDLNNYTRENIVNIVETVAGILNCRTDEILVNGVYHSRSFMLVLSMRDIYIKKWMNLSERDCHRLTSLHIDYFILNQKIFQLESSKDSVKSKIAVLDDELLFAKLCSDLANDFPWQKFQQLRSILSDSSKTRKMESLLAANSVLECFAYLLEENLFSKADVSFIQFICKETNCEELQNKCVEYARRQEIHFFEEEISERKPVYIIDETCTKYKIHQCSKCPAGTEYFCVSCPCDLCSQCKENHVKDLQTIDHDVVSHRDKINYIPTQEICVRHPSQVYTKYCEPCELPVCFHCRKHRTHRQLDVRTAFKTKRQQHRGTIHTVRSEAVFYRPVLLPLIKTDFKTCHTELSLYQSDMLKKAQTLKNLINKVKKDFMHNVFCDFDFKHRCSKQRTEMNRHIVSLERYENIYEQSAFSALKFLSSIKTALCQIYLKLHSSQLSITESLNKEDVMESLSAIQIKERGNRCVGNQCLLKLSSGAEFHQSLTLTGVDCCFHISCVTSDRVWVSDGINKLILTDTTGAPLHRVEDSCSCYVEGNGFHTVNSESELIYIGMNYNINKLSTDMRTTTTFIERTDSSWEPMCVYWSPSTVDLLVGMYNDFKETSKVTRYNQSGHLTQTIQHDNTGRGLYRKPCYITENNNGDVVVSDSDAVVVTEREGRHRFSYTGHPTGSGLRPHGICTDALSHILVCDELTKTVQMIDKNGQFLSDLLIRPSGIFGPKSLSYDINTHRLWVGSEVNKTVVIYRYITRKGSLTDLNSASADVMESLSEIPTPGTEKQEQKLMSPPKLLNSLTLTCVDRCLHISCVTSDRVWVSGRYNLVLTDTTGVPLYRVEDSYSCYFGGNGVHTVNRCVYSSPFTGDLLVGGHLEFIMTGKVSRYNQRGQLTQTMQYDNKGLQLYEKPRYITEINNGDVVVSDSDAVVVTQRGGRHRFSYTGHPTGSGLRPNGICTDALSHILVCDGLTETVQMIDKDGQFLSHLLIRPSGIFSPWSLSYDVNTHRLWVGSEDNNTVVIYRYITRKGSLTDQSRVMESLSGIPTPGTEKPQQGNQCLLKLTSGAEFHQSLTTQQVSLYIVWRIHVVVMDYTQ
eukprot:XP_011454771.2 PREDICTED: uncharacterized protein LOC105347399 [Crassostrea gigas]